MKVADPKDDKPEVAVENKKAFDKGYWVETAPMAIKREYVFDQVGKKDMYLLHHEELESLGCNLKGIKRIRFFMTFGQSYLTHLKCLENVGLTRMGSRTASQSITMCTMSATTRSATPRWARRPLAIRRAFLR